MSNTKVEEDQEGEEGASSQLSGKEHSSLKFSRNDSLDMESRNLHGHATTSMGASWSVVLPLAFQSLGVVYGDIGTSPLYVYSSIFLDGIKHHDDILGVLSLIFYTITLIPMTKYVFIVLRANDNGDGGTFALYSLICRYAKVGLIPSQQAEDKEVSNYRLELSHHRNQRATKLKSMLENSNFAKLFLLLVTMLGTSMVIGDGILTPCISVLSAVGGIKVAAPNMTEDMIVWTSVGILVGLFVLQRFGTDKVGYTFAPVILVWFVLISVIGVYNIIHHDIGILRAINPMYIVYFFERNKKEAWIALGGTILSTTGAEAMFADVGHFSVKSIQISMCSVVYPSLILAYTGQAAYLSKHPENVADTFFKSLPGPVFWPMFVVAILGAIIASQALISGSFSIIQQSLALGCFPRVKVVHTSDKYEGQVFIPEINYTLMAACVLVTIGFRTTAQIGNAYGIAVGFVMTLTSALLVLVMILIWKTNILLVILYILVIGVVELVYLSSVLYKFNQGGYLPLIFALFLMAIMYTWNSVHRKKYHYELQNKITSEKVKEIVGNTNCSRIPGLAIFYSELVQGIPPIFKHYLANVPALHTVLVFVSIKSLPISKVPPEERFVFRRVKPRELNILRCVVRYGYTDARNNTQEPFETILVERLKEFLKEDDLVSDKGEAEGEEEDGSPERQCVVVGDEMEVLDRAWQSGVVHLVGETEVIAEKGAGLGTRILINYAYDFLKRNVRQSGNVFDIPHQRMLKVGMIYEL